MRDSGYFAGGHTIKGKKTVCLMNYVVGSGVTKANSFISLLEKRGCNVWSNCYMYFFIVDAQ